MTQDPEQELRIEPAEDWVAEHAVEHEDAVCWVHLGQDDAHHPYGGWWFPSGTDFRGEGSGVVNQRKDLPDGELIQFPCEDREPYVTGDYGGDLAQGVADVNVLELMDDE